MAITVYGTSMCPYCVRAKEFLEHKKLAFTEIDVSDPQERMKLLEKAAGRRTVPQIFIDDFHVGGYDDLMALDQSGELDKVLASKS